MSEGELPASSDDDAATATDAPGEAAPEDLTASDEATPEQEAEGEGEGEEGRGPRAKPVTVAMLKAAARSPADVKDIVATQAKLREKRASSSASTPRPASPDAPRADAPAASATSAPATATAASAPAAAVPATTAPAASAPTAPTATAPASGPAASAPTAPTATAPASGPAASAPTAATATAARASGPTASAPTAPTATAPASGPTASAPTAAKPGPKETSPAPGPRPASGTPAPGAANPRASGPRPAAPHARAETRPATRPAARPAAAPPTPARPAEPARTPTLPPAPTTLAAPRARGWAAALLTLAVAAGLLLGAALLFVLDRRLEALAAAASRAPAPGPAPSAGPPTPTPPSTVAPRGSLAELGDGRVIYTVGDGRLVVLRRDPTSGELEVERVYRLSFDPERHLGEEARRLHGVYLDDEEAVRRRALADASARFRALVAVAAEKADGIEPAEAAAAVLARAGGAAELLPLLDPNETRLRRRVAALGLGEAGYLAAVPYLGELLSRHSASPELTEPLCRLLARLTGMTLDPADPEAAALRVQAWVSAHPLVQDYSKAGARSGE
ncbi:MAG: hypothetical protein AB7T09_15920 [Planctomycetota bacterium]